jgi:hypothetical protein
MLRVTRIRLAVAACVAASAAPHASAALQAKPQASPQATTDSSRPAAPRPAILVGHVTDSAGVGVPGAEISLLATGRVQGITGDSGEFRLPGLPSGTVVFSVRRIGFEAATFTAVLKPGVTHRVRLPLNVTAQPLPVVAVADTTPTSHWLDAFNMRRSSDRGVFITREQIVKRNARTGVDVVRGVPGIRVSGSSGLNGGRVTMTRGNGWRTCVPTMYVHGMPYSGTLEDFVADDIEALEVYVGISEIPPELDKNGRGICGAIVVWTRDPTRAGKP